MLITRLSCILTPIWTSEDWRCPKALYIDLDKGNWKLIVNKQLMDARRGRPQWGIADARGGTTDDPANELGRTALTMGKPAVCK